MSMTIEQALEALQSGNQRFVSGKPLRPHTDKERLRKCLEGQHPFACILACSDSRVPVDLIFDTGVGDLFVVKVPGNVFGDEEIGSAEYALEHLAVPLLVVMGHNDCGMVKTVFENGALEGRLNAISKKILLAVEAVKSAEAASDQLGKPISSTVDRAARTNVWNAIQDALVMSPIIASRVKQGSCRVLGAFYWINNGEVEWLGEHPQQEEIFRSF